MGKELGTASEMVTADLSGGFHNLEAAVYNFLGMIFSWLSTHQGLALIIILSVLAIVIWFILRRRQYGKQLEEKVSSKNIEIGQKDALIEEQKNKLEVLQKKMSDQQGFISEALLRTIMTLKGYNIDQLQIFFKNVKFKNVYIICCFYLFQESPFLLNFNKLCIFFMVSNTLSFS